MNRAGAASEGPVDAPGLDPLADVRALPSGELPGRVEDLAACERGATAALVAHLGELEGRDLHLRAGFGSLFSYCREALSLSEGDAYNHVQAARAVRRFPAIRERLEAGHVNLTTVRLLAPYLTPDNHREVLDQARGKGRARVEELVARLSPMPDVPPSLRKLPSPSPRPASPVLEARGAPVPASDPEAAPAVVTFTRPILAPPSRSGATVAPLSPERYRLQVTIGGVTLERLRLARDLLRHAIPSGDDAAVIDRALVALLAELARKKFAAADLPRPARGPAPGSRHIPAEVKRAVFMRDLGRCAFVAPGGRRCGERAFVEFHHVRPFAEGGEATVANIELRCRRHNDYESRLHFGPSPPAANGREGEGG